MKTYRVTVTLSVPVSFDLNVRDDNLHRDLVWSKVKPCDLKAALAKFAATAHPLEMKATSADVWPTVTLIAQEPVKCPAPSDPFALPSSVRDELGVA